MPNTQRALFGYSGSYDRFAELFCVAGAVLVLAVPLRVAAVEPDQELEEIVVTASLRPAAIAAMVV